MVVAIGLACKSCSVWSLNISGPEYKAKAFFVRYYNIVKDTTVEFIKPTYVP